MKRWLASRLQRLVVWLMEPVVTRILDQVNAAGREQQTLYGVTLARIEGLLLESVTQDANARREIVEAIGRDFAVLVRTHAALEGRVADLHDTLHRTGRDQVRDSQEAVSVSKPGDRHVIFLSATVGPDNGEAAALLDMLRVGLDRLEDAADGQPVIWIERPRTLGLIENAPMARDTYIRIMKGGTRSVEVLTPADAFKLAQALEQYRRSDVQVIFRWIGTAALGQNQDALRRALGCADHWIFPTEEVCETILAKCGVSVHDCVGKLIHIHPLPEATGTASVTLADAYRLSVKNVLGMSEPP